MDTPWLAAGKFIPISDDRFSFGAFDGFNHIQTEFAGIGIDIGVRYQILLKIGITE